MMRPKAALLALLIPASSASLAQQKPVLHPGVKAVQVSMSALPRAPSGGSTRPNPEAGGCIQPFTKDCTAAQTHLDLDSSCDFAGAEGGLRRDESPHT